MLDVVKLVVFSRKWVMGPEPSTTEKESSTRCVVTREMSREEGCPGGATGKESCSNAHADSDGHYDIIHQLII